MAADRTTFEMGDVHGLHANTDLGEAQYDFEVRRGGRYAFNAVLLPETNICSCIVHAAFDDDQFARLGENNVTPMVWRNADYLFGNGPNGEFNPGFVDLGPGWHRLRLRFHQDGVTLARFHLKRVGRAAGEGDPRPPARRPLDLYLTRRSMALVGKARPEVSAWVRNNGQLAGEARIEADLDPGRGRPHVRLIRRVELRQGVGLTEVPLAFDLPEGLPAREFLLTVTLSCDGRAPKVSRETTFVRPFSALFLGPLSRPAVEDEYLPRPTLLEPGTVGSAEAKPSAQSYKPFPEDAVSWFGLYDLCRASGAGSKDGILFARGYVAFRVDVPVGQTCLLKVFGDDFATLWVDGRNVYQSTGKGPPVRYPGTVYLHLTRGEHRIIGHVEQTKGWWQYGIHLRTKDDRVSDVEGVP